MFDTEFDYFKAHQADLVAKHEGRTLVLRGAEVVGVFDSDLDAYLDSVGKYPVGSFMIQPCIPGQDAYTATIATLSLEGGPVLS